MKATNKEASMDNIRTELIIAMDKAQLNLQGNADMHEGCKAVLHLIRVFVEYMDAKVKDAK